MLSKTCAALVAGCALLGVGCVTVRVAEIPPPDSECPTEDDIEELARLLPQFVEPSEIVRVDLLAVRFVDAAAYCQLADKRLR
jgi:hypothetical protein